MKAHPTKVKIRFRRTRIYTYPESRVGCIQNSLCQHDEVIGTCKVHVEQKADEMPIVEMADTVIDPGAVMVYECLSQKYGFQQYC